MLVLCLTLDSGKVQPLGCAESISKKQGRRLTKKFMNDDDVTGWRIIHWEVLYDSKSEAKKGLPSI